MCGILSSKAGNSLLADGNWEKVPRDCVFFPVTPFVLEIVLVQVVGEKANPPPTMPWMANLTLL